MSTTQDLIDQQGWNDETMLRLYDEFIARAGLDDAFAEYLELVAKEENNEIDSASNPAGINTDGATGPKEK